jgi:hypothetical protein
MTVPTGLANLEGNMKIRPTVMQLENRETPTSVVIGHTGHTNPHNPPPPRVAPAPTTFVGPSAEPEIIECDWRINIPGGP